MTSTHLWGAYHRWGLLMVVALVAFMATTWMNWLSGYSGGDTMNYQTAWSLTHLVVSVPKTGAVFLLLSFVDLVFFPVSRPSTLMVRSIVFFIGSAGFTFLMYLACFPAAEIDQYDRLLGARLGITFAVVALGAASMRLAIIWRLATYRPPMAARPRQ